MSVTTTTISVTCPSGGCGNNHTAVVKQSGHDRAETHCHHCGNTIVIKTLDGSVVKTTTK